MAEKKTSYLVVIMAAIVFAVAVAGGAIYAVQPEYKINSGLPIETLTIKTRTGVETFTVEIAQTPVEQEIGLMFRKEMDKDHGMIFRMGAPKEVFFWMKNTLIPLDIIFIAQNGRIANIHHNATPENLTPLPSKKPVVNVLEINGGEAEKRGIKIGDKITDEFFK